MTGVLMLEDCAFAGESFYIGQKLRGELGCLEHATWLTPTLSHCSRAVHRNRSRHVVITVENVRVMSFVLASK